MLVPISRDKKEFEDSFELRALSLLRMLQIGLDALKKVYGIPKPSLLLVIILPKNQKDRSNDR